VKIAVGFDHAGVPLRDAVIDTLLEAGHEVIDCGAKNDYPDIVLPVCRAVVEGEAERGVLCCGSGAGVGVAACKIEGISAQTIHDTYTAHQAVEHDKVNVLCMGARVIGSEMAAEIVRTWAAAEFSGAERHLRRLAKVELIAQEGLNSELEDSA